MAWSNQVQFSSDTKDRQKKHGLLQGNQMKLSEPLRSCRFIFLVTFSTSFKARTVRLFGDNVRCDPSGSSF